MSYTVTTRTDGVNDICVCWCFSLEKLNFHLMEVTRNLWSVALGGAKFHIQLLLKVSFGAFNDLFELSFFQS